MCTTNIYIFNTYILISICKVNDFRLKTYTDIEGVIRKCELH